MASSGQAPLITPNSSLQTYYGSLESRIGYRLLLGGTRHFGYYDVATYWPFPIGKALRAMEDHLLDSLQLGAGAEVLDAGCGVGHVAIHLARRGLRVQGIDVVDHHLQKARRNVKRQRLDGVISLRKMDYHHLGGFADQCLDGVYTMETFVHATDPEAALAEFFRVLKPGGTIALYEYDHVKLDTAPKELKDTMDQVNRYAAMPAHALFDEGVLPRMLEDAGFIGVKVDDLTPNIKPMLRLFFVLACLPYLLIRLFGLQAWFVNTVAAANGLGRDGSWRYIAVTARKPLNAKSAREEVRERKRVS